MPKRSRLCARELLGRLGVDDRTKKSRGPRDRGLYEDIVEIYRKATSKSLIRAPYHRTDVSTQ